jgi:hypothetical protein
MVLLEDATDPLSISGIIVLKTPKPRNRELTSPVVSLIDPCSDLPQERGVPLEISSLVTLTVRLL